MKQFPERPKYQVSSTLPAADRAALERLFFFNENQARLRDSVVRAVEGYGGPKIVRREGMLRLVLPRIENAQTLYFRTNEFNPLLVGVVVYVREERNLKVLFWALRPDCTCESQPGQYLLLEIVETLKDVGSRIVGVDGIAFEFGSREYKLRI
ncbi:MAG: hypothetical protein ACLQVY_22570 [Limisphaerales bacterium]